MNMEIQYTKSDSISLDELINILIGFYLNGCEGYDEKCEQCKLKGGLCDKLYDLGRQINNI